MKTGLSIGALAVLMVVGVPQMSRAASDVSPIIRAGDISEMSSQARRRGPTRLRVYRLRSYPGPNAVRDCEARYVQEYRPSGTVIVPRVNCFWRPG